MVLFFVQTDHTSASLPFSGGAFLYRKPSETDYLEEDFLVQNTTTRTQISEVPSNTGTIHINPGSKVIVVVLVTLHCREPAGTTSLKNWQLCCCFDSCSKFLYLGLDEASSWENVHPDIVFGQHLSDMGAFITRQWTNNRGGCRPNLICRR